MSKIKQVFRRIGSARRILSQTHSGVADDQISDTGGSGGSGNSGGSGSVIHPVTKKPLDSFGAVGDFAMTTDGRLYKKKIAAQAWEDWKPWNSPFRVFDARHSAYNDYAGSVTFPLLPASGVETSFRATIWEDDARVGANLTVDCADLPKKTDIPWVVAASQFDNGFAYPTGNPDQVSVETCEYRQTSVTWPGFGSIVVSEGNGSNSTNIINVFGWALPDGGNSHLHAPSVRHQIDALPGHPLTTLGDPAEYNVSRTDITCTEIAPRVVGVAISVGDYQTNKRYLTIIRLDWSAAASITDAPAVSMYWHQVAVAGYANDPQIARMTDTKFTVMCRATENDGSTITDGNNFLKTSAPWGGTDNGRKFICLDHTGGTLALVRAWDGSVPAFGALRQELRDAYDALPADADLNMYCGGGMCIGAVSDTKIAYLGGFKLRHWGSPNLEYFGHYIQVWDVTTGTLLNTKCDIFFDLQADPLHDNSSSLWSGIIMENGEGVWFCDVPTGKHEYDDPYAVPVKINPTTNAISLAPFIYMGLKSDGTYASWSDFCPHKIPEITNGILNGYYWMHTDDDGQCWLFKDDTKVGVPAWVEVSNPDPSIVWQTTGVVMTDNRTGGGGGGGNANIETSPGALVVVPMTFDGEKYVKFLNPKNFGTTIPVTFDVTQLSQDPSVYVAPQYQLLFDWNNFDSGSPANAGKYIDLRFAVYGGMPNAMRIGQGDWPNASGAYGFQYNSIAILMAAGLGFFDSQIQPLYGAQYIDWYKLLSDPQAYTTVRVEFFAGQGWRWYVIGESEQQSTRLLVGKEPTTGKYFCPITKNGMDYHILVQEAGPFEVHFPFTARFWEGGTPKQRSILIHSPSNTPQDVTFVINTAPTTITLTQPLTEITLEYLPSTSTAAFKVISSMA